ncbi:MAG TPA: hypothetical protein VMI31_17045 [Fimbriimonadaceae bacterium]|nr:hypothetical protein [Fimbriimonadaceae bacterium]
MSNLNVFAAEKRTAIYEDLLNGREPREGLFDPAVLREAKAKGSPQMGTTTYTPAEIKFEFIYPDPNGAPNIVAVTLPAPERIVFLPVPSWVVENIWQGSIAGTPHFESEANRLVREFEAELCPEANPKWFERSAPTHRE